MYEGCVDKVSPTEILSGIVRQVACITIVQIISQVRPINTISVIRPGAKTAIWHLHDFNKKNI